MGDGRHEDLAGSTIDHRPTIIIHAKHKGHSRHFASKNGKSRFNSSFDG